MSLINFTEATNGNTANASDINTPLNTIYDEFNGNISSVNLASDAVTTAKLADDAVTAAKVNFGGSGTGVWWEEIGRTTLGSAGDTISVTGLPERKYLKVIISALNSGQIRSDLTFNNDTGSNYDRRFQNDMTGSPTTQTGQTSLIGSSSTSTQITTLDILNIASTKKVIQQSVSTGTSPPDTKEQAGVWTNTSDAITRIDVLNGGSGDFASGSEIVVLGHD